MNTSLPTISHTLHQPAPSDPQKSRLRADSYIHLSSASLPVAVGQTLSISWLITRPTHTQDWIGLYPAEATRPLDYLEFKRRGGSVQKAGIVKWRLNPESFPRPETRCRFMYYSSANELLASSDVITVTAPHCHSDTPGHSMHVSDITIREFLGANDLHVLFLHVSVCQVAESGAVPPLTKILLLKTATSGEITWRSDLVHNLSVGPQDQLSFEVLAVEDPDTDTYKVLGCATLPLVRHCMPGESKRVSLDLRREQKQLGRLSLTLFFLKPANQSPASEEEVAPLGDIPLHHSMSAPQGYRIRLRSDQSGDELEPPSHLTPLESQPVSLLAEMSPPTGASELTEEFTQALQNLKFPLQAPHEAETMDADAGEENMEMCRSRYEQRLQARYRSDRSLDAVPDSPRHVEVAPVAVGAGEEERRKSGRGSLPFTRDSVLDLLSSFSRLGSLRKRRATLPSALDPAVRENPAVRFLLRRDLYTFLEKRVPSPALSSDLQLLAVIQEVRYSPNTFLKWHKATILVTFLNRLADTNADMPRDWEIKLSRTKERVFVNHQLRFVTFIDPRLPVNGGDIVPPGRDTISQKFGNNRKIAGTAGLEQDLSAELETEFVELDPGERIIAFLRRDDIFTVVGNVMGEHATPQLSAIIREVANRGQDGLERHQNSEALAHFLSMVDHEIEVYNPQQNRRQSVSVTSNGDTTQRENERGQFMKKAGRFWGELRDKGYDHSWETHTVYISRDAFLSNAFQHIMHTPALTLRRRHIRVQYDTEEGIDEGGLVKEFFFHLSHELFSPSYGLFEYSADGTYSVQVQKNSIYVRNYELWFRFAGRLIGMSLVQQQLMDVFFSRAIIKPILQEPFTLNDLEAVDPGMYRSLRYVLSNSDTEDLVLTFSYQEELPFGEVRTIDLVKDGHLTPVTNRNKARYVDLMVESRMCHGVEKQTRALVSGVREIVPLKMLKRFDASELEWLISGTAEIDLADWKANTLYSAGISDQHPVVRNFWRAVEEFENEDRLRLLQFITGSSSIPLNGFQGLTSTHGHIQRFTIRLIFGEGLPESHTCFNRLDIPRYDSFEELKQKLLYAIRNTQGFNVA